MIRCGHRPGCLRRVIAIRVLKAVLLAVLAVLTALLWAAGHISAAVLRARWAWRCRGRPVPGHETAPLTRDEKRAFTGAVDCWRRETAPEPERSRT